jgi:hypothetical protein
MTVHTHSLTSFASLLSNMAVALPAAQHTAMESACVVVEHEAKRVIGTYDYRWRQLAPSTQADRVRQGFAPNDPLLRTGAMRASISHVSSPTEGRVGSNDDKAVWQELGTRTIPPRSFLAGALQHKAKEVVKILGLAVVGYIESGSARPLSANWYTAPPRLPWPAKQIL